MDKAPNLSGKETGNLEFTNHARRSVEKTVTDPYFRNADPEMILDALISEIQSVAFGDYLKRYIRRKRASENKETVPDVPESAESEFPAEDEADWLCEQFRNKNVPPAFTPTSAKIRALVKNWLGQRTVSRSVVLLLGFAMEMSPEEVNELLTKALREPRLDPKDPFEVVCWYCYQFRLPYARFEALWKRFSAGRQEEEEPLLQLDSTVRVRRSMEKIGTEEQLAEYITRLGLVQGSGRQSISARRQFDRLYDRCRALVADIRTDMEQDDAEKEAGRIADRMSRSDRIYDYEKRERIGKRRKSYHTYQPEEISPADIENVLYSAVPKDRNGNLVPMKDSLLNLHFWGKRLTRQHIAGILAGEGPINRFDLITLSFLAAAGETEHCESRRERYKTFIHLANQALRDSDMDLLYIANPYESFVLMCMLTEDPLGSFADVWELSYQAP